MLQGRHASGFTSAHGDSTNLSPSPLTSAPPGSSSLADSIRALRESPAANNNRSNILPQHSSDPRAGRRRLAPSPLGAASETAADSWTPQSPQSPAERSFYDDDEPESLLSVEASRSRQPISSKPSRPVAPVLVERGNPTGPKASSYSQFRNVSAPVVTSAGPSPPSSPTTMLPASRQNQIEPRPTAQRNASIDSAVSSISSTTSQSYRSNAPHMFKPSQEAPSSNPPDMNTLIAAAGSPEAALLALWKEKQGASVHNTQLWRLVEKQRTMILGLNKDLERALKDKERYRKKLKEHLAQVPPLPYAAQRIEPSGERDESRSPANSEGHDTHNSNSAQGSPGDAPRSADSGAAKLNRDIALTPSPVLPNPPRPDMASRKGPSSADVSPIEYRPEAKRPSPQDDDEHISPKSGVPPPTQLNNRPAAPTVSVTQATPQIGIGEFPAAPVARSPQPLRKPPPAPLNLSQQPRVSSNHLRPSAAGNQSDDSDDDDMEVDEISLDRGRRRTREDDDRVREVLAKQELEERSRSKKQSKSKSKSKPPADHQANESEFMSPAQASSATMASPLMASGLPSSPRLPPATNSINALLSPAPSDSSITQRTLISPALMSPGLPMSPRPGDRPMNSPQPRLLKPASIASPPLSPRAPKQPIPMPNTTLPFASPHLARAEAYAQQANQGSQPSIQQTMQQAPQQPSPPTIQQPHEQSNHHQNNSADLLKPPTLNLPPGSDKNAMLSEPNSPNNIFRGLMSEQYPGLLLPPNALPSIQVKVFSSRLQPSRYSMLIQKPLEEDPVFILAIYARSDGKQLWRNEKTIHALPALDQQIRALCDFAGRLPDRSLFSGHAPAKIDARRAALNTYFDTLLDTPMNEMAALVVCEFFSTDVFGAEMQELKIPADTTNTTPSGQTPPKGKPRKEGYLTKRGKNFGGWKARYFLLEGPELRYYETAGGAHLGTIKLISAQIGKQSQAQANQSPSRGDDNENQYRHAFLVLEPKRKDSSSLVRHVLCAESDEERDAWVEALLQYVDYSEDRQTSPTENAVSTRKDSHKPREERKQSDHRPQPKERSNSDKSETLRGISYEQTVAAEAPVRGPPLQTQGHASPKIGSFSESGSYTPIERGMHPSISGPTNGTVISDASQWGNKANLSAAVIKDRKRSIFAGFSRGGRSSSDIAPNQAGNAPHPQVASDRIPPGGSVFGIPLQEAVNYTQPHGVDNYLPSVVYRCLEYLQVKGADKEEGIFRLSGSNIVIKALRERFNNEGDVRLLDGQYYDVHAVASLLKLYLRELPSSILTRDLHLDFLKVLDLDEREKKIAAFNILVHRLPRANFELLQALSSFLIDIINNANVNKMTVRNVGIVFAPTLNIPAPLISMFLTDYADIFGAAGDEAQSPIQEIVAVRDQSPEIRSPRHQMFSDIPSPTYSQTSFNPAPSHFPMPGGVVRAEMNNSYETGFIPMRPSYETPTLNENSFASMNSTMRVPPHPKDLKAKRRESSMLFMNPMANPMLAAMNKPRQGSLPHLGTQHVVREESSGTGLYD